MNMKSTLAVTDNKNNSKYFIIYSKIERKYFILKDQ